MIDVVPPEGMDAIQEIRRSNLAKVLSERFGGNQAALARAAGKKAPLFNDVLSTPPRKGFGENLARSLEARLELPPGYFDKSPQREQPPAPALGTVRIEGPERAGPCLADDSIFAGIRARKG